MIFKNKKKSNIIDTTQPTMSKALGISSERGIMICRLMYSSFRKKKLMNRAEQFAEITKMFKGNELLLAIYHFGFDTGIAWLQNMIISDAEKLRRKMACEKSGNDANQFLH